MPPCCSPELFVACRSEMTESSDTPGAAGVRTGPAGVRTGPAVTISTAPGTPPTAVTGHHLPALNGLRALAVLAVMAYHLQLGWASGGYLGVDLFFVLSGFLITTLLLEEWVRTGASTPGRFWARRARRLLPRSFVLVAIAGGFPGPERPAGCPGRERVGRPGGAARRRPRHAALRRQLARHLRPPVLLRPVLGAVSPAAHLVIGDRRAVLPRLAAGVVVAAVRRAPTSWRRVGPRRSPSPGRSPRPG